MPNKMTGSKGVGDMANITEGKNPIRSERVSVAITPDMAEAARAASLELGMTLNAWLGMAIGRAVRAHRMEREVLVTVLKDVFGEQMKLELENLELPGGTS